MKIGKLYCPYGHGKEHHVPGVKDDKGKILRDPFCRKCRTYKEDGLTVDNYGLLAFRPVYDMDEMTERYVGGLLRNYGGLIRNAHRLEPFPFYKPVTTKDRIVWFFIRLRWWVVSPFVGHKSFLNGHNL